MALKNVITLNVDIKKGGKVSEPTVVQNDSVRFIIVVQDGGKPLSAGQLSEIKTVTLANVRPDRQTIVTEGTLLGDDQFIFDIGSTETDKTGKVRAMVQMYDANGRVSSLTFSYTVVADPTGQGYEPSEREQTLIEVVLGEGPLVLKQAMEAAEIKYIEPFSMTNSYKKNNLVSFGGSSYFAKKDTKGNEPPNLPEIENEYWGLAARKGADGTGVVVPYTETFKATKGMRIINLKNPYDQFQSRITATVGGVPQKPPKNFEETSATSITFYEDLPEGVEVVVEYFSESFPLASDIQSAVDGHTQLLNNHTAKITQAESELENVNQQLADTANEVDKTVQSFFENGSNSAFVTFVDDDGTKQFVERLKPVFDSEGVRCSLAINPGVLGHVGATSTRMLLPQLLGLQDEGYEIVSHGHKHISMNNTGHSDETLTSEIRDAKNFMKENGLKGYKYFVYPNGVTEADYRTQGFVRKYHECGIGVSMSYKNSTPINQFALHRSVIDSSSLSDLKAVVDLAVANNEWIIFLTHSWFAEYTTEKIAEVKELIQYIKSKNVGIGSIEEGLNRLGNAIDYRPDANNYLKVSKTGKIDTSEGIINNVVFLGAGNSADIDMSITSYRRKALSIRTFSNGYTNSPTPNTGGVCHTYRPSETSDTYSYQEWTDYTVGKKHFRYWHTGSGTWSAWTVRESVHLLGGGTNTQLNDAATAYALGVSVRTYANGYANSPTGKSGTCTTVRPSASDTYTYQDWTNYDTGEKYTRQWSNQSSAWLAWNTVGKVNLLGGGNNAQINDAASTYQVGISVRTYAGGYANAPDNTSGVCTTVRPSASDNYTYQEWATMNVTPKKYVRQWSPGTGVWAEWTLL